MKEMSFSFCSFDSTWLSMVRLARGTTTTQHAFNFYQNEDGNFCLCCCRCSLFLFHCCLQWCQSIVCVACPASVAHVTHGASVTWLYFYCFFASSSLCVLLLFSTFLSWVIWGINMPNLPEVSRLVDLLVIGCICRACTMAIDTLLTMIVVVRWVLLWYSQRPHDTFVAFVGKAALWLPRLIATALLVVLEERLSCERFGASQWWRQLHPLQSVMALIMPIAIGNGIVACCCLTWLYLVPMIALCSQLG